jgi:hypothetical protein
MSHFTDEVLDVVMDSMLFAIEVTNEQSDDSFTASVRPLGHEGLAERDVFTPSVGATLQDVTPTQFLRYLQGSSEVHRLTSDHFTASVRPDGHEDRRNCVTLFCASPKSASFAEGRSSRTSAEEFHELVTATVRFRSEQ